MLLKVHADAEIQSRKCVSVSVPSRRVHITGAVCQSVCCGIPLRCLVFLHACACALLALCADLYERSETKRTETKRNETTHNS